MEKKNLDFTDSSRRNFTKAMVTAAVAAPVFASMIGCAKPNEQKTAAVAKSDGGPKRTPCFGEGPETGITAEHIPPIGVDGGNGSIIIETHNILALRPGTFEYQDTGTGDNRYGEIEQVRVITELSMPPYLEDVRYGAPLSDGCQLLLWYQKISASAPTPPPTPPADCHYDPNETFNRPADVTVKGGGHGQPFTMTFPGALKPGENTFKCNLPTRYTHADVTPGRNHFRVGKWRIIGPDGSVVVDPSQGIRFEDSVKDANRIPEHFRFYIFLKDYQS